MTAARSSRRSESRPGGLAHAKAGSIRSVNPATEEVLAVFEPHSGDAVEAALERGSRMARRWREVPLEKRADILRMVAFTLRAERNRWASLITLEMGKPIAQAEAEIDKCARTCEYYAEHGETFLRRQVVQTSATESYVAFEPLGVVLAIMPWNYPFWQVLRFAVPALLSGNGVILKHAANVPQSALGIEALLINAGLPPGIFQTLLIPGSQVGRLLQDDRIQAVTLTGSTEVGREVASTAGRNLKKQVLELGGSDPFVVLADADVELAAATAARARIQNNGQSCIAAKRFIVVDAVADDFVHGFARAVSELKLGDPMQRSIDVGPLARADLRDTLARQVERSVAAGAQVMVGAGSQPGRGYFYQPTVLDRVRPDMEVFREETFGPAAAVVRVKNEAAAIAVANATPFGLGASLWTADIEKAKRLARDMESGSVFVNEMVASDPRLPFGGIKASGYGRELGEFGIREFTNVQTVWIQGSSAPGQRAETAW
jgi:succinate-semialdehyde dehydrogenase/glutarate-semialdehyde dehydrogenase